MSADHKTLPPVILASGSAARKDMLSAAGLDYTAIPADIDEAKILGMLYDLGYSVSVITENLAAEKARHISAQNDGALVIGSDQTLEFENQILSKAKSADDAALKLKSLRGKTHALHSSVCVALDNKIIFTHTDTAELSMRDFDDDFLTRYMAQDPDALTSCVGAYKIEGAGAWLFSEITGNNFTIMGMPLLPLLGFLHDTYGFKP